MRHARAFLLALFALVVCDESSGMGNQERIVFTYWELVLLRGKCGHFLCDQVPDYAVATLGGPGCSRFTFNVPECKVTQEVWCEVDAGERRTGKACGF